MRAYLNAVAADHAKTTTVLFPMPIGSVLAKAVVPSDSIPNSEASRVYFMKKEAPGFDPEQAAGTGVVEKSSPAEVAEPAKI